MFDSIRDWIDVPITVKPFLNRTGTGEAQYGEERDTYCYPQTEIVVLANKAGVEVKSGTQLFVDGIEDIDEQDSVVFEGSARTVQATSAFYRDGKPDIKVIYL